MAIRISLDVSKVFYSRRNTFFQFRPRVTWTRSNFFLIPKKGKFHVINYWLSDFAMCREKNHEEYDHHFHRAEMTYIGE